MTATLDEILADTHVAAARDLRENHAARPNNAQARFWRFQRLFLHAIALAAAPADVVGSG